MSSSKFLFLSGGTGTPKLLQGAISVIDPQDITIIGNTGDDWDFYGLYVSPDVDSILLTLSNMIDEEKWWGIKEDSFNLVSFLRDQLEEDVWFNLGDFDSGLCLFRSNLLSEGNNLTEATDIIRKKLNINSIVLPMANQRIKTKIRTSDRTMHLQEFWVRYKGAIEVLNVFFEGDLGKTTSQVLTSIKEAEIIILGPSNPISSLGPMLAIQPLREALQKAKGFKIAVSPIIGTEAVSGPTAAFLKSWGKPVSPITIGDLYNDFLDSLLIHNTDESLCIEIQEKGIIPVVDNIYIHGREDAVRLIRKIMDCK
jgi:LPPG:FO 2-phospho-L-lactate transferase